MEFDIIMFKQRNLDKFKVSFTAHPGCIDDPMYKYENSGFGLRILYHTSNIPHSLPQFLNLGIYTRYDYDTRQPCITNSEMFLLGHDMISFDIDEAENVYIVCNKLKSYSIPFTCVVDTGHDGRAHIIVALEEMIPYHSQKEKEFRRQLNKKLMSILTSYNKLLIDASAFDNPVAFVRVSGAYRIDTGE